MPFQNVAISEPGGMIFAETDRLILRALEHDELPRLAALIGEWDIARWLSVVPFPYTLSHAEEFYGDVAASYAVGKPQFYAMALKTDNLLVGGVGFHEPRNAKHAVGEMEVGYWLGKDYWGCGLMSEAVSVVIAEGFDRPETRAIGATTAQDNQASQNVLRKAGLRSQGLITRDYAALRGDNTIVKWLLTREEWEERPQIERLSLAPIGGEGGKT